MAQSAVTVLFEVRYQRWWATLEAARVFLGARCGTMTVSEGEWLEHWRAGLDPVGALLTELRD